MVIFDRNSIVIRMQGDKDTYLETIKALNNAVADLSDKGLDYTYLINNLINDMLPDFRQIINLDEVSELDKLKLRNQQAAESITNNV